MEKGYKFAQKNTVVFEWKIVRVSSYLNNEGNKFVVLNSTEFTTGSKIGDKWKLRLYLENSNWSSSLTDVSIFLHNLCSHDVAVNVKFFILNNKRDIVPIQTVDVEVHSTSNLGFPQFISKVKLLDNMAELIPNDTLTLHSEVTVIDDALTIPIETDCTPSKSQLATDLGKLYESKDSSDVTIIVGDTNFQAHKMILSVRSPVLAAVFTHDMTEKKSNEVTITDINPEVFEKVLKYIYTDEIEDLDDVAAGVLEAADKYQLLCLKKICEEVLMESLNGENIVERLALADRHSAKNLKDYAIKCIIADAAKIIESDGFKELEKSNPSLALEFLREVAIAKSNHKFTFTQSN